MKNTVSLNDLLKKTNPLHKGLGPLSKNTTSGATDFIRENNVEKPKSNLSQTQVKLKSQPKSNLSQTQVKPESNLSQKPKSVSKAQAKPKSQLESQPKSNLSQTQVKLESNKKFPELSGCQKRIMETIFMESYKIGNQITQPLTIDFISKESEVLLATVRRAINRLEEKGFLLRKKWKVGRGGWTQYKVPEKIYNEMLQLKTQVKLESNLSQTQVKGGAKLESQLESSRPSSNILDSLEKTITAHENKKLLIESEWSTIQTPEILKKLGFGKSHIDQFKNKFEFAPEQISKFLEAYAYDLENGELEKIKNRKISPIGYFFGALKGGGYNSKTEGFKTSEEIGKEEMLARLEKRKKEREERKQKLEELLFEEWLETKTDDELVAISKPSLKVKDMFHLAVLKDHFLKNEITEFQKGFHQ